MASGDSIAVPPQYLGSEAQRLASTAVPPVNSLVVTRDGGIGTGDGVTQAKNVQPSAYKSWRGGENLTSGAIRLLPTGELGISPTTFTTHATDYTKANNGNPINWTPMPSVVRSQYRNRDWIRAASPLVKARVALPPNVTCGTSSATLSTTGPTTTVAVNALTTAIPPGVFSVSDGTLIESFYTSVGAAVGDTSITVVAKTPVNAVASGATVQYGFRWSPTWPTPNIYRGDDAGTDFDVRAYRNSIGTLSAKITAGAITSTLTVNPLPASITSGAVITLVSPAGHVQSFQVTATAASGATSVSVGVVGTGTAQAQYDFPAYNPNNPKAGTILTSAWFVDSVSGNNANTGRAITTLQGALVVNSSTTTLNVKALGSAISAGTIVLLYIDDAGTIHKQAFSVSAAASAAASLTITAALPKFAFPVGTQILSPFQSFGTAYTAASSGDSVLILDRRSNTSNGVMYDNHCGFGFSGSAAIDKSLNFIALFEGEPRYVTGYDSLTWTATSGQAGVYQATQNHAVRAVDINAGPREGVELIFTAKTAATLSATLDTSGPTTTLPVTAMTLAVPSGATVVLNGGGFTQAFTLAGNASVGDTALTIASTTPNFAYTSGTAVWSTPASIAACQAAPGSWFTDSITVWMHTAEGNAPDNGRHIVLLTVNAFITTSNTAPVNLYMQGFDIFGGNKGCVSITPTTYRINRYSYRTGFMWPGAASWDANAVSVRCGRYSFSQEDYVVGAQSDNFSYHGFDLASAGLVESPVFIEINCVSHSAGMHGGVVNPNPALLNLNNATTAHGGALGIRIGKLNKTSPSGLYRGGSGTPVADVHQNTQSVQYSIAAGDSKATSASYDSSISAQQSFTEMWAFDSIFFGSAHGDAFVNLNSTLHLDDCQVDTRQPAAGGLLIETNAR